MVICLRWVSDEYEVFEDLIGLVQLDNITSQNYEFKKGVGIDSTIKSAETRILLSQFSLQKFNPYFWPII